MMVKGRPVWLLLAGICLPISGWAGYQPWQGNLSDFGACAKALQREVGTAKLRVEENYWVEKTSQKERRLFLNAVDRGSRDPVRAVCQMSSRHRVASIVVSPGHHLVNEGTIATAIAAIDEEAQPGG